MGSFSDYFEKVCLDLMTGKSPETTRYVALLTAVPDDADTGATIVEPSTTGTGYARLATTADDWDAAADDVDDNSFSTNAVDMVFPAALAQWGQIVAFAICTSATVGAGNVLGWSALDTPQDVDVNDLPAFVPGELKIKLN